MERTKLNAWKRNALCFCSFLGPAKTVIPTKKAELSDLRITSIAPSMKNALRGWRRTMKMTMSDRGEFVARNMYMR